MTPMNPMDIDYESILDNRILRAQCLFSDVMVIPRCMKCGSFEMVIDATQATREGVMCLKKLKSVQRKRMSVQKVHER